MSRGVRFVADLTIRPSLLVSLFVGVLACAGNRRPVAAATPVRPSSVPMSRAVARAPLPPVNPKLPPVPSVDGSLHITVVYPPAGALITSRDSNFIFGSVGNGNAGLTVNGTLVPVWPNGAFMGWVPNPPVASPQYALVAYTAIDTVRYVLNVRINAAQHVPPPPREKLTLVQPARYAILGNDSMAMAIDDTDRVVIGRPEVGGTYRWFLLPGTIVRVTGYLGDMARVQLDTDQTIWVARRDVKLQPTTFVPALHQVTASLTYAHDWIDLNIVAPAPPPYIVDESARGLTLTLYNTTADATQPLPTSPDAYLTDAHVTIAPHRTVYTFAFARPSYGYLVLYHDGIMTFRIRRPPMTDPAQPLRGLTIAIDPGHPPIGATGPTGLYEPVPTLAVGFRVRDLLTAAGATVVMTRTDPNPVALGDRPIIARRANANALVSIHLNALPDGMNPFHNNGTGTYYFHTQSERLASLVQESLVPQLGLRDLGTFRENLALARPTWMPSILTEGVFIIMPDQEAAIRTPQYQEAYARGIVNGLEQFFATFAQ